MADETVASMAASMVAYWEDEMVEKMVAKANYLVGQRESDSDCSTAVVSGHQKADSLAATKASTTGNVRV